MQQIAGMRPGPGHHSFMPEDAPVCYDRELCYGV